jgi:hypothetical protein
MRDRGAPRRSGGFAEKPARVFVEGQVPFDFPQNAPAPSSSHDLLQRDPGGIIMTTAHGNLAALL